MIRHLFDNLEINWQRLSGPAIGSNAASGEASRCGVGERDIPEPTLRHVRMEDLRDTKRLLVLYDQAVKTGLIDGSDHMRIEFVSLAEHALERGTTNPCGLFVYLLKNGLFDAITQRDEGRSMERLREFERQRSRPIVRLRKDEIREVATE